MPIKAPKAIDPQKIFGNSVKVARNLLGMSQETLADLSGLHRTYISDVERGSRNPSLKTIIRLAHSLEVSISTLFPLELQHWKTHGVRDQDQEKNFVDILLAEDEEDDVELTLLAFKQARFANRIHVVRDGSEALDYLFCRKKYANRKAAQGPQLILLDLNLPKVSGLEVLAAIRADKRTAQMPVVVLAVSHEPLIMAE